MLRPHGGSTFLAAVGIVLLASCGGGGGGGGGGLPDPPRQSNRTPVAAAGPDLEAVAGQMVQLDASRSSDPDSDSLTFQWQQGGGEVAVVLTNPQSASPAFSVPESASGSTLSFQLTASDPSGASSTDTVLVSVTPGDLQHLVETKVLRVSMSRDLFGADALALTPWQVQTFTTFSVVGFVDEKDAVGGIAELEVAADAGQILFLFGPPDAMNPAEAALAPAYVSAAQAASGEVSITAESIATALVLMQPEVAGMPAENFDFVQERASFTTTYRLLVDVIESLFRSGEPPRLLDADLVGASAAALQAEMDAFAASSGSETMKLNEYYFMVLLDPNSAVPQVHPFDAHMLAHLTARAVQYAMTLMSTTQNASPQSAKVGGRVASEKAQRPRVSEPLFEGAIFDAGEANGPHVIQFVSSPSFREFYIGNPTFVLYGYSINGVDKGLIGARDSTNDPTWQQAYSTLGDGEHEFVFTRGVTSFATPLEQRAATANALKAVCSVLKIVFSCPVSSTTIARAGVSSQPLLDLWEDISKSPSAMVAVVSKALELHGEALPGALIKLNSPLKIPRRLLGGLRQGLGVIAGVVNPFTFAGETAPFIWDLAFAIPLDVVCVAEEKHRFSPGSESCDANSPPEAAITTDPLPSLDFDGHFFSNGLTVTYSAEQTTDDRDELEELRFSWTVTLDGQDGIPRVVKIGFDHPDSGPVLDVRHSTPGELEVHLAVMDTNGSIGEAFFRARIKDELAQPEEFIAWSIGGSEVDKGFPSTANLFKHLNSNSFTLLLGRQTSASFNSIRLDVGQLIGGQSASLDKVLVGIEDVGDNGACIEIDNKAYDAIGASQGLDPVPYLMCSSFYTAKQGLASAGTLSHTFSDVPAQDDPATMDLIEDRHQYMSGEFDFYVTDIYPALAAAGGFEIGDLRVTGTFNIRVGACGKSLSTEKDTCTLPLPQ